MRSAAVTRTTRTHARILCLVGSFLLASCGGGGSGGNDVTISNQVLSGKIGGQAWSLGTAQSNPYLSSASQYFVDMYPSTFTPCGSFAAPTDVNELIVEIPNTVGSYNLSLSMNATFYVASSSDNWVATQGRIVIESISATTITGGANITYNADNAVDGKFQVAVCP